MKKKIKYLLFIVLCNFFVVNVYAASASITARASSSKVQVGQTVKVTINVSSSTALGSWEFNVGYDNKVLTYVSSNLESGMSSVGFVSNANTKNKTYTLTFKAKAVGVGKVTIKNADVYGFDENSMSTNISNATITVESTKQSNSSTQSGTQSSSNKSANNYLSSLSVDGKTLNPKFDKNVTNYSLSLENNEKTINVSATADDKKSTVVGLGSKALVEGNNKIEVTVTAENGNKKTYTINVNVKEKDPIVVTIGDKEYTVVQRIDDIEPPTTYTQTTTIINNTEVPAFKSSITDYTLVGLTDESGNTSLYIYNDDSYKLYKEYKFGGVLLYIKEPSEKQMIKKIKETTIKIDGDEVKAYKLNKNTYPLIYGLNVETGQENWYTYDESENTLQKFVSGNKNSVDDDIDISTSGSVVQLQSDSKYKTLSYMLCGIISILFMFLLVSAIKISAQNNKKV